jgi:hypothetical protein
MELSDDTRVLDLTLGQLREWLCQQGLSAQPTPQPEHKEKRYVAGLSGIMELFGVSEATAFRLKRDVIQDAVIQQGRLILVDADKAIELFRNYKQKKSVDI